VHELFNQGQIFLQQFVHKGHNGFYSNLALTIKILKIFFQKLGMTIYAPIDSPCQVGKRMLFLKMFAVISGPKKTINRLPLKNQSKNRFFR
jgi:hypothetical protein